MQQHHRSTDTFQLQHLQQAAEKGLISNDQYLALQDFLQSAVQVGREHEQTPKFIMAHFLYYLGGLIAIGAMSLFMTLGFELYGGVGIMLICVCYAIIGMALAQRFYRKNLLIPHTVSLTFVLCLVPLFVFGLQKALGIWVEHEAYRDYHTWISWQWIYMELATLAVGAVMLYRYRRAFLVLPIAVTLWYLSMDLSPLLFQDYLDWEMRRLVSLYVGLLITGLAFWVDVRRDRRHSQQDYAFWLYVFGVMTFWGAMSLTDSSSELAKFGYLCINLLLMGVGLVLLRRVFVVFGGLGVAMYLGHLAYDTFKDSMIFPLLLTFIGLGVVYLGVLWQQHETRIHTYLFNSLPAAAKKSLHNIRYDAR